MVMEITIEPASVSSTPTLARSRILAQGNAATPAWLRDFDQFINDAGFDADWWQRFNHPASMAQQEPSPTKDSRPNSFVTTSNGTISRYDSELDGVAMGFCPAHDSSPFRERSIQQIPPVLGSSQASWNVSETQRLSLRNRALAYSGACSGLSEFPSCHMLSRFYRSYADHFYKHFPIIHLPTFHLETVDIELALVVAAIGAQYRFERRSGERLYHAAKAILTERFKASGIDDISSSAASLAIASLKTDDITLDRWNVLRVLILLIGFAAWDENSGLLKDAFELQGILSSLLRRQDVKEDPHIEANATNWLGWVEQESRRRTLLVGFAYLGIQNLAYDLSPLVRFSDINLKLPCPALQWATTSAEEWTELNIQETSLPSKSLGFQHAMEYLLTDVSIDKEDPPNVSTLGNFILLQALLQRIEFTRHMQLPRRQGIREGDLRSLGVALDRWKSLWRRDRGSSLDPDNPDGPLPFTSVAFLALGYVRLHLNMGPHRNLWSRDPEMIAAALGSVSTVQRGSAVTTAISHSVHALSLPIKMGIEYVSRSQMFFWSCQHSLCGLECAVFTWKWLETIHVSCDLQKLAEDEACIVDWIRTLVCEATQSIGTQITSLAEQNVANLSFAELGVSVLRLWSRVFIGNTMWPVICQIGKSLEIFASTVEKTWVL
ncbi:hypothetical protein NU219Hw_g7285t1 [Hortaea werneckii]